MGRNKMLTTEGIIFIFVSGLMGFAAGVKKMKSSCCCCELHVERDESRSVRGVSIQRKARSRVGGEV